MSAARPKLLALQFSEHHLQCAVFEADTLVRHEELTLYPSATSALSRVSTWLEDQGNPPSRILASATPRGRLLRLSSARGSPFAALSTQLALPPGEEPVFTACNAQNGDPSEVPGLFPRLLAAAPLDSLRTARDTLANASLRAARLFDASYVQLGALTLARETMNTPVLVWDLGTDSSHFVLLDQRGILAVEFCPVGYNHIQAAIKAILGLRFATAATKLFVEGIYDFSDTGSKIARRFLPELRECLTRLPVGPKHFHIIGLSHAQQWLTTAIAEGWCLQPLTVDWAAYGRAHGISFATRELAASLPVSFGGLLLLAKHRDSTAPSWQARWSDEPKPAPTPTPNSTPPVAPASASAHPRRFRPVLDALAKVFTKPTAKKHPPHNPTTGKPSPRQT